MNEQQLPFESGPLAKALANTGLHATLKGERSDDTTGDLKTEVFESLLPREDILGQPEGIRVRQAPDKQPISDESGDVTETRTLNDRLAIVRIPNFSRRQKVIGCGTMLAATAAGFLGPHALSDSKITPYPLKVDRALTALHRHPFSKFSAGTLQGTGAASLRITQAIKKPAAHHAFGVVFPAYTKLSNHTAYATAKGSITLEAGGGLVKKLVAVHNSQASADRGWSLRAVVDADKISAVQGTMTPIHNSQQRRPDAWTQGRMAKVLGSEQARFNGTQTFIDSWAAKVMLDRCADNTAVTQTISSNIKKELDKDIAKISKKLTDTDQASAIVLRNLLPVKRISYQHNKLPKIDKELLPGHVLIAGSLKLPETSVLVGAKGYCKPVK